MSLPKTTLAAILVEQNKPLVIDEITLPETLEAGQVLVEFFYSGICGSPNRRNQRRQGAG